MGYRSQWVPEVGDFVELIADEIKWNDLYLKIPDWMIFKVESVNGYNGDVDLSVVLSSGKYRFHVRDGDISDAASESAEENYEESVAAMERFISTAEFQKAEEKKKADLKQLHALLKEYGIPKEYFNGN